MNIIKVSILSLALSLSASAGFANITQVKCDDFIVGISEEIAAAAEERASSQTEAHAKVCEAASQIDIAGDDPETHTVTILPYGIETTVLMVPLYTE
ncbi:hypothetical protein [Alloyangia pacifica]|uniref:hypothetical protein n=1 Tax=Alloyangia pacifica TaxID=311180 RepID=UPI0031D905E2